MQIKLSLYYVYLIYSINNNKKKYFHINLK